MNFDRFTTRIAWRCLLPGMTMIQLPGMTMIHGDGPYLVISVSRIEPHLTEATFLRRRHRQIVSYVDYDTATVKVMK